MLVISWMETSIEIDLTALFKNWNLLHLFRTYRGENCRCEVKPVDVTLKP